MLSFIIKGLVERRRSLDHKCHIIKLTVIGWLPWVNTENKLKQHLINTHK